jgi:hypothetical protein
MGMDVIGKNPSTATGEYFRNNIWAWRPLWNYCVEVAPEICENVRGDENGGDGLDAADAEQLAQLLLEEIHCGRAARYKKSYDARLARLPRSECSYCDATGIRSDEVGVNMRMPDRELDESSQILFGRTHGWCNGCRGEGKVDHFEMSYPFTVENVQEFAEFCSESGGFEIH